LKYSGETSQQKLAFLHSILQNGGEGVVAHNLRSIYSLTRSKNVWVKIKSTSDIKLQDTIDGFVTGFVGNETEVTHLVVSMYVDKDDYTIIHKVAEAPIPPAQRFKFTDHVGTSPVLKTEIYNMVCELAGSHFNSFGKLVTPTILRFRGDKAMQDCKVSKAYLDKFTRKNTHTIPDVDSTKENKR
jgi:ATP-dependent DNA ligase